MSVALAPTIWFSARVRSVTDETAHCRSFELDLPEHGRASFEARPGQFVALRVAFDGSVHDRSYSLSSVAALGEALRITVKRVSRGTVSSWIVERLAPGDVVEVRPPAGDFFVRPSERPLLFVAAGSGVTPIFAMIRAELWRGSRPMTLLYVNRSEAEAIFLAELRRLRAAFASRMILAEVYGGSSTALGPALAACLEANADADLYICGPAGFMDRVERAAELGGVPADRIYTERFAAGGRVDEMPAPLAAVQESAAEIVAQLSGVAHAFRCPEGMTLLEAALAAGVPAPFSCREGHCGACITTLCGGAVDSAPGGALSRRDRLKGRILACRSKPTTPSVIIDYDV